MSIDVIIPHYEQPRFLRAQLLSLAGQVDSGDRVLIAEDGDSPRTAGVVAEFASELPITHLSHEDLGSRKCFTRNHGLARSSGDLVLYLDQDIILPPGAIHRLRSEIVPGYFLGLRRVMLDAETSEDILRSADSHRAVDFFRLRIRSILRGFEGRRFLLPLRNRGCDARPQSWRGMASFGMMAYRDDLIRVNGWDNRFDEDYYAEDFDLFARLEHAGVRPAYASRACTVFHMFHRPSPHNLSNKNYQLLSQTLSQRIVRAGIGLEETIRAIDGVCDSLKVFREE